MKSYSSREVALLIADGWYEADCKGDHHQFKRPVKKQRVTVSRPVKDIKIKTLKSYRKANWIKIWRCEMRKPNKYIFPAIFTYYDDGDIAITFPDLPDCTSQVSNFDEKKALTNAVEVLGFHLNRMETDDETIPIPTPLKSVELEKDERAVLIEVYMPAVRHAQETRSVNRTVTLPAWLNYAAIEKGINFSQVLQNSLIREYGLEQQR
ncbi:MAG: type II toxin-antitoxin system HicA family toxin [Clostridiales bacterium]|jgi:predicted RNA binding protein YcfA (HicA-like mRNA interferase family)/predicted RNase H-like HicB family nuclease|nr:type II toxin-antitoxin system HicA family toxin [Clostridiales bacterium]